MKKLILFILFTISLQIAFAQRNFYTGKWQSNSQYKIAGSNAYTDTLRPRSLFPVSQDGFECGTTVYLSPGGGYVAGTNGYNDIGCYQEYDLSQNFPEPIDNVAPAQVTGMLVWFRYDSLGFFPGNVRGVVYSINDSTGAPEQLLDSSVIPASQVDTGSNVTLTYFNFPDTPTFYGKIAAGVEFQEAGTAQLGIVSTITGCDQINGFSWDKWHDSTYHTFSDPFNTNLDIDLYILPIITHPFPTIVNPVALLKPDFQIYPNPVNRNAQLNFKNIPAGRYAVEIEDITGKIVFQSPVSVSGDKSISFYFPDFTPGIYICKVTGGTIFLCRKFIKQ